MHLRLLLRFHVFPWLLRVGAALRQGPLVAAVAAFLMVSLVGLTVAGQPILALPGDLAPAAGVFVAVTTVLAAVLWGAGQSQAPRWRAFFGARPHGTRAWLVALSARALGAWVVAVLVVAGLSGPPPAVLALAAGAAIPFTLVAVLIGVRRPAERTRTGGVLRLPGPVAWWAAKPLLFGAPLVLWGAMMAWAVSGQAGFVWSDRPPIGALFLDFGWLVVFGLLWSEVSSQLPYAYFRQARAPFRRVFAVVGLPVAAATLVVVVVEGFLAADPGDGLRAVVLSLSGTVFWFAYWLRFGPANLAHFMLFVTLFLVGASSELSWWPIWAAVQGLSAVPLVVGWRTRYYEGESHAGS